MFEKVCAMLADQLGIPAESIKPEQEVVKDLGADSLDVVELMMALEDEYGITLPEGEVEGIKTVQDIVDMMNKLQKEIVENARDCFWVAALCFLCDGNSTRLQRVAHSGNVSRQICANENRTFLIIFAIIGDARRRNKCRYSTYNKQFAIWRNISVKI